MDYIPVPNVAAVQLVFSENLQVMENTLYFEFPESITETLLNLLGSALVSWWSANLQDLLCDQLSLDKIILTDLTTSTSISIEYTEGLPVTGSSSSDALPMQIALVASFKTAFRGRSFRGRNYVTGFVESQQSAGIFDAGVATALRDAYAAILTDIGFIGTTWVVVSRFTAGAPRAVGLTTPITGVTVDRRAADQRRRRFGVGG